MLVFLGPRTDAVKHVPNMLILKVTAGSTSLSVYVLVVIFLITPAISISIEVSQVSHWAEKQIKPEAEGSSRERIQP